MRSNPLSSTGTSGATAGAIACPGARRGGPRSALARSGCALGSAFADPMHAIEAIWTFLAATRRGFPALCF